MVMGGGSGGGDVAAGGLAKFTEGETYPNPKPIPNPQNTKPYTNRFNAAAPSMCPWAAARLNHRMASVLSTSM